VPGEDDRIANSHGGRTNGFGMVVITDGRVVISGGNTQPDGTPYFDNAVGRQSILVMAPAKNPLHSRYRISPNPIPPGTDFGGAFGDHGRNQLVSYPISNDRVVIAGGNTQLGEDLFDTYVFDGRTFQVTRGPDLPHAVAKWGPDAGYPPGYQCAIISSREVGMHNSRLVFSHDVLVGGGAYNGVSLTGLGSRHVEQLARRSGDRFRNRRYRPTEAQRSVARQLGAHRHQF
jgi:hypothetical protein